MPKPCHANHVNYDNRQILINQFLAPTLSPIKHTYFQGIILLLVSIQVNGQVLLSAPVNVQCERFPGSLL